ncbi:hypothetical protein [Anabaena azotica]|uniref:PFE-CTERM domain-containing protein n=1 Tax=Anabaena azotica TaxID=197653 RepID=UPI0039A6DF25
MRSLWLIPASVALSLSATLPSMALTVSFTGNLTGQPVFDSPDIIGTGVPTTTVGFGDIFPYSSQPFYVNTSGNYNFLSTSVSYTTNPNNNPAPLWNNVTILYQGSFNPATPLNNAIIANNDFPTQGLSGFNNVNLTANTQYYFVTTVFNPDDGYGTFSNSITGVAPVLGTVPTIPFEFSPSLGLLIFGVSGAFIRLRKQKKLSLLANKYEQKSK